MRLAIMQPYFLPYIGYFQLINAVNKFVLLDDVQYINKGWINRNRLLINRKATLFTVPLQNASQNKLIKDIKVSYETNWQSKLLRTIDLAYRKAPFFSDVFPVIYNIITAEEIFISGLAYNSLMSILNYIRIDTEIVASSSIYANEHLKAQDRILDICRQERACHYINPVGGAELYQKEAFTQKNIKLNFINPAFLEYKQHASIFVPGLSITDVLMHNSREQVIRYLQEYSLK